jgi:hypothetical protein
MNDRDTFAAAALTGLIQSGCYCGEEEDVGRKAYASADAMLAERARLHSDAAEYTAGISADAKTKCGETTSTGSPAATAEPVAWAVMDGKEAMEFCTDNEEARCAAGYYNGHIVPLYRSAHPALTDAEREAVRFCALVLDMGERPDCAATLLALLERRSG